MATGNFIKNKLQVPPAPVLPSANPTYLPQYQEQYSNILRLYFNRMSGALNSIAGVNGGQYVDCPNGLFFNTGEQMFAAANTAYSIVFDQQYLHNAVDLVSSSRLTISVPGIYNFQYTGQVLSTNSSAKTIYIWISRNGTNIGYSARAKTVAANNQYTDVSWSFDIDLQKDDYVELKVSVSDTALHLHAETASSPHPGIPSSVMTVNFIAPLPDTLPTPP